MNAIGILSVACLAGMWSDTVTAKDLDWGEAREDRPDATEHTGQPITRPMRVPHTYAQSGCLCPMCLGSHLINAHGLSLADWERLGLATNHGAALRLHRDLHRRSDPPTTKSGCGSGGCPTRPVLSLFPRLFRR